MAEVNREPRNFRRNNVIRTGVAYGAGSWLVIQVANSLLPAFAAPNWVMQALVVVLALGFPAALMLAWFLGKTAHHEGPLDPDQSATNQLFDRRLGLVVMSVLVAALLLSVYGNLRGPEAPTEPVSILIADFENETDNRLFSGVLEDTLGVGLETAPFIQLFSRNDAASIARSAREADTGSESLDLESASLVALRQGVDIVIGGRTVRTGGALEVSLSAIAPGDQRELFSATETAATDADMLNAMVSISRRLRIALGDTERPSGAGESESFAVSNLEAAAEYLIAQDLQLDRRLEEAVVHYQNALTLDPEFARAYAGLAITQQYLGNMEAARNNWAEVLPRLDRLTERGRLRTLGHYYMIFQRDYDRALETYVRLVDRYPVDNVAQNNLAVTAFYALDFQRALDVGREVAGRFQEHSGYGANLALYAMYASQFDEAADVARRVIANDPNNAYSLFVLATTSAVAGDLQAAEEFYRRMTTIDQFGRSIAVEGLADLALYRGDTQTALDILAEGIEAELSQNAGHSAALKLVMQAEALLAVEEREEARAAIETALQYSGNDPAILAPGALMLADLGDLERAAAIAENMLSATSKTQRAYANAIRAKVALLRGDEVAAAELANSAVETADLWLVRFIRGDILLQTGRIDEARTDYQICRERVGEGSAVFLNDRPSLRLMKNLDAVLASMDTA